MVCQEDCGDLVRLEDILSGVSPFLFIPLASKGGITVMIVLATLYLFTSCNT